MTSLLRGIKRTFTAPVRIKKARKEYETARDAYLKKFENYKSYSAVTEKHLEDLGECRADGMREIIEAVEFLQQHKAAYVKNPQPAVDAEAQIGELERLGLFYGSILGPVGARTLAGAAVGTVAGPMGALGAYGLAGAIGVASTGTAVSSLSGAAASSATLAWLGGGALSAGGAGMLGGMAVLGGIVALPALITVGLFLKKKADDVEREVERKIQEIRGEEAKIEQELALQGVARQRANELQNTITGLISELKSALQKAMAEPNWFQRAYRTMRQFVRFITRRPKTGKNDAAIFQITQISKALRDALDEPVILR